MRKIIFIALICIILPLKNSFGLGSGGIGNEVITTKTLILGGSILVENDPGNVYLNPALLGDMGKFNNTIGINYINYSAERDSNGSTLKMDTLNAFSPNFFLSHNMGNFGFGLGLLSPYGLQTDWGQTSSVRYVATKSEIKMFDITPAISYRFSNKLAIGLGLDYFSTFSASLEKKAAVDVINFILGVPTIGAADANSKIEGDGNQWGYHSSITFSPVESHSFAVSYHSEVKTKIEGSLEINGLSGASAAVFGGTNFKTDAATDLFYPQNVQIGYRWSATPQTKIFANTAWYDWSANKQLEFVLPNATSLQKSIAGAPVPLNWRDVWSLSLAIDHSLNESWLIGGSIFYESSVYPESTFSPAVPDLDRYGASIGTTFNNKKFKFDFIYEPILLKKTTINNSLGQTTSGLASADISGTYKGFVHILGFNLSLFF